MPALAKFIAMPPPIVPAPSTAALPISRFGVSLGTSGILPASRSAKKKWRCAFDWSLCSSSSKSSRSRFMPCSKGSSAAAWIAAMQFCGAMKPRFFLAHSARAFSKTAGSTPCTFSLRALTGISASARSASSRATLIVSSRRSPSTTRSTMPSLCASLAPTGSPAQIISIAFSTPTSRGRRCVPPDPGRMPSFTSGRPTFAEGTAIR